MRVIAGSARGRRLAALPGEEITRPTIERVKEGMFSALQFLLPGAQVLDLFAGSGQLGIEALSRGAAHCTFVDQNHMAAQLVLQNCRAAGVQGAARVVQTEAQAFLARTSGRYHIILLDPPYRQGILADILPLIGRVTEPGGIVLCESELDAPLPDACGGLQKKKQYRYGTVLITRYEKERAALEGENEHEH